VKLQHFLLLVAVLIGGLWVFSKRPAPAVETHGAAAFTKMPSGMARKAHKVDHAWTHENSHSRIQAKIESETQELGSVSVEIVDQNLAVAFGDVLVGEVQNPNGVEAGLAKLPPSRRWPTPEIPYANQVSNPERVEQALKYLSTHTPLKFVPYNGQKDAIVFTNADDRCLSYVGRVGGTQPIFLSPDCGVSEIMHEVLHAVGFIHEQSRADRDPYVEVLWDNIEDSKRGQFEKLPASYMEILGSSPFDYHSIMMYSPRAFAKAPDLQTLRSRTNERIEPAENSLSPEDIARLERLYPPPDPPPSAPSSP
jgi:hypothetical protein